MLDLDGENLNVKRVFLLSWLTAANLFTSSRAEGCCGMFRKGRCGETYQLRVLEPQPWIDIDLQLTRLGFAPLKFLQRLLFIRIW